MAALTKAQKAVDFMEKMGTQVGRKARFGDPERFKADPQVFNIIREIDRRMAAAVNLVDRLTKDESRTEVSKHARAKKAAGELSSVLRDAHDRLIGMAAAHKQTAHDTINETFDTGKISPFAAMRKLAWLEKHWPQEGGPARIREAIKKDPELATLCCGRDAYTLDINEESLMRFAKVGIAAHCPEANDGLDFARVINETAAKLPDTISEIHSSFYLPGIAIREQTRVED